MKFNLKDVTLKDKFGQMLMIGIDTKSLTEQQIKFISDYSIGGVIIYKKNYANYKEMIEFVKKLKSIKNKLNIPLFVAVDQEGGRVNRMPNEFKNILNPTRLTNKKDLSIIKEAANVTGEMLKQTGINMNFAPVLDLKRFDDNHVIGNRCFGNNPKKVSLYGIEYMNSLQQKGIISVVKHFPGLGISSRDSHLFLPVINNYELLKKDIIPFKKAIDNNAEAIMIGHILIKDINRYLPISLDKDFINSELRKKMKYQGLIITDDLRMKGVNLIHKLTSLIKRSVYAGNDVILFKYKNHDEKRINRIFKIMQQNEIIEKNITESFNRIIKLKTKYIKNLEVPGCNIEKINKKIERINNQV